MAGPSHFIRRYQKAIIAGGIVMLMIAFAIQSVPNNFMGGGATADPVVFSTRQGDVHEVELQRMMVARRQAHQFLIEASSLAVRNVLQERTLQSIPPNQIFEILLNAFLQDGIDLRREVTEEPFVRSLIVAQKAQQVGLDISDESVNQFLRERTLNKVTPDQFKAIIDRLNLSKRELFGALRLELLGARLREMVFGLSAVRGVPPGLRWDYFERLNRKATAQTLAVPVESFVAQVPTPDEAQLQALYNEHKDDYAIPGSPEAGFRLPEQGKFAYFKADYEKFAATVEVTEAEVADYYEKNKRQLFLYTGIDTPPAAESKKPAAEEPADEKPADEAAPPAAEKPATEQPATETPAVEGAKSETPPSETPAAPPAEQPPAEQPPAEQPPAEAAPSGPQGGGGDDAGQTAAGDNSCGGQPAAETPSTETPATEPAAEAPAGEPALNAPATTPAEPAGQAPAAESKSDTPAGDAKAAAPAADKPEEETVEPDEDLMLPETILSGPNPEFEPLWRVEERIRELLRRERAGAKVREVFSRLTDAVDEYSSRVVDHAQLVEEQGAEKAGAAPTPPDFAALAAKEGVTFHTTDWLTPFNADESELGKSFVQGNQPFVQAAFQGLRLRIVRQSADIDGNQFLFWKTEEKRDNIPSFADAREAVERTWKFQQARQLALKKAQELAAEAERSGKTLQELFGAAGTYKVNETGEFSWMSELSAASPEMGQAPPEISEVPGVDQPGDQFMRMVFDLEPKQTGAALNGPETIAYVVQVNGYTPGDVVLRERFMVAPYRLYMGVALNDERKLVDGWIAQLEKEAGLDWRRPPDEQLR